MTDRSQRPPTEGEPTPEDGGATDDDGERSTGTADADADPRPTAEPDPQPTTDGGVPTGVGPTEAERSPSEAGPAADEAGEPSADPEEAPPTDDAGIGAPTTGAESVVAALERAGVETVFGVQGGAIMPVYDALADGAVDHVTMAHEQGAAHAADAYGIVRGDPGVCMATSGPGATNLVTGLADADMDSDPLIALTGQVPTEFVGNDAFQETDTTGVAGPITKHTAMPQDADDVGAAVAEAAGLATTGRPGPTLVDLPKDVTQADTDEDPGPPAPPERAVPDPRADPAAVETAAAAIERAERPLLLLGGGVVKAEASEACRAFAVDNGIPVVTTLPAMGTFPEDHDLALEWAGMHGTGYANAAITHTDCLIAVGCRFDDRLTGDVSTFAPEAEVVHVDVDPAEISKNVHADYPLIGDAGAVVDQLAAAVTEPPATAAWRERCRAFEERYPMDYAAPADRPVQPQFVVEALDAATDDDAIVTTGVGQHQMWAAQYWTFTEPRTWVSSHGLGTMGYGLPAAIGARIAADDDRQVVCVDGDGSFLMTVQELSVAVREELDITVAVLNNEYVGMVRQWQDAFYDGRRTASEYGWCPEFDVLAEAFGAKGIAVDDYDEVADAIETALTYDGPAVIDFHVDPATDVYPMVPSGGDTGRFALSEDQL